MMILIRNPFCYKEGPMKKKLKIDNDKEVIIMIEKVGCDFACLYPKGWKIENKVVIPSTIHFEESFYIDISRESFDSLASFDTKYTRILILKGVKKDIFIHINGEKNNYYILRMKLMVFI